MSQSPLFSADFIILINKDTDSAHNPEVEGSSILPSF